MAKQRVSMIVTASFLCSMLLPAGQQAHARRWEDASGQHSVEAELEAVHDGVVRLKLPSGRQIRVPLTRLSRRDQEFVSSWMLGQAKQAPTQSSDKQQSDAPGNAHAEAVVVDERLFLLHLLEYLYRRLALLHADDPSLAANLIELRRSAANARERAMQVDASGRVAGLYDDFLRWLKELDQFRADLDALMGAGDRLAVDDSVAAVGDGAAIGATTYGALSNYSDATSGEALAASVAVGAVTSLLSGWSSAGERKAADDYKIGAAVKHLEETGLTNLTRAQVVGAELAAEYGWQRGEAGFALELGNGKDVHEPSAAIDYSELERRAEVVTKIRPRDPFACVERCMYAAINPAATAATIADAATTCETAAALVPSSPLYDEYRALIWDDATQIALLGRHRERLPSEKPFEPTEVSRFAAKAAREAMKADPIDATGERRFQLAEALLYNTEVDAALAAIGNLSAEQRLHPDVLYVTAAILSRRGDVALSLSTLDGAIRIGMWDMQLLAADPDFENVRTTFAQDYARLVQPRWACSIAEGWFTDDVTLTNNSNFPLTAVELTLLLVAEDGQRAAYSLKADAILPGENHVWSGKVAAISGEWKSKDVKLVCSECSQ